MFRRNAAYLLIPPERKHDILFVANFSFYLLLKATRKQEAIWRSRLYPRTRCLHLVNIWLHQPWLRVQKIEASACSSPAECLELPAGEWRRERDGGAWPGGQLEEEAEVDQEGEGGDQQWHHHQDLAETLRRWWPMLIYLIMLKLTRWKNWQAGCKTLAECGRALPCCRLRHPPLPSPTGQC